MEALQRLTSLVSLYTDRVKKSEGRSENLQAQVEANKDELDSHKIHTSKQLQDVASTQSHLEKEVKDIDKAVIASAEQIGKLTRSAEETKTEMSTRWTKFQERADTHDSRR